MGGINIEKDLVWFSFLFFYFCDLDLIDMEYFVFGLGNIIWFVVWFLLDLFYWY